MVGFLRARTDVVGNPTKPQPKQVTLKVSVFIIYNFLIY